MLYILKQFLFFCEIHYETQGVIRRAFVPWFGSSWEWVGLFLFLAITWCMCHHEWAHPCSIPTYTFPGPCQGLLFFFPCAGKVVLLWFQSMWSNQSRWLNLALCLCHFINMRKFPSHSPMERKKEDVFHFFLIVPNVLVLFWRGFQKPFQCTTDALY